MSYYVAYLSKQFIQGIYELTEEQILYALSKGWYNIREKQAETINAIYGNPTVMVRVE